MADNLIRFKKRKEINIGIIIFSVILVYVLFHVYNFFTKSEISLYEVQPGTIYVSSQCDGMILREEELVYTETAGYVNYYFGEGSRVAKNCTIYSIDSNRDIYDLLAGSGEEIKLSGDDLADLKEVIQETLVYEESTRNIKAKKAEIMSGYQRLIDTMLLKELNQIVTSAGVTSNFHVVSAEKSGIISYSTDEFTNYTLQDVTADCFLKQNTASSLYSVDLIAANSPVYKIITDDIWKIVVQLDDVLYGKLLGQTTATFTLDNEITVTAPINCYRRDNAYFAELTMDKYLSNFSSERFVKVKFELEHIDGLKIPESAITFKDYYRIPKDYLTLGGNEDDKTQGILVEEFNTETGTTQHTFKEVKIFYSTDGFVYIDCSDFTKETYIVTADQSSRVMLYTFVNKLEGAYNINKGYAVFKRVERLKTENGYVIVKKNSVSGLSAYDHIALDAEAVIEDAVIY